jgi:hypothetical protein
MTQTIDSTAVEEDSTPPASMDLVAADAPTLAVAPQVEAGELVKRLTVIKDAMHTAMTEGVDYGVIPGTGSKPTLLKPGAEKLAVLFQLDIQTTTRKEWGPDDHLTVEADATVFHAPTGIRLASGEGLCSTREKKYGKRRAQRECPNCGKPNIRTSKDGDGFYCWRKTDGCGAQFPKTDQRIVGQIEGEIDNPDLPDTWNTVVKMAKKRAVVDAVLLATGASALFTQDAEDHPGAPPPAPEPAAPPEPQPALPEHVVPVAQAFNNLPRDVRPNLAALLDTIGIERLPSQRDRLARLDKQQAQALLTELTGLRVAS